MGTASLIIVSYKDRWVIAQFSAHDGYPDGQGKDVARFVSKTVNLKKLERAINKKMTYYVGKEELGKEEPRYSFKSLLPRTGAKILDLVANTSKPLPLVLMKD